jgi:glutathione S-transferase
MESDQEQLVGGEGVRVDEQGARALIAGPGLVYFGNRICPFAHRAFWAAAELGVDAQWTYVHIDLGPRKPAWFSAAVNPAGTVPCLFSDGQPVFESLIVAEFLSDRQGGALLPADAYTRALARLAIAKFDETCKGPLYGLLMSKVGPY